LVGISRLIVTPSSIFSTVQMVIALGAIASPQPGTLVDGWRHDQRALAVALDRWDKAGPPPPAVVTASQYQQRVIRVLAANPPLARRVEQRLPAVVPDIKARLDLNRLAERSPPLRSRPRVGAAVLPGRLLQWYREAQQRFGVRWQLLAAINFVESAFGRVRNTSGAGAQGPMQFMPATWRAYGLGGNVHDPHDAILGAANYLAANNARHDERTALFHYNPSTLYVDAISRYANHMARSRDAFYVYYCWRVHFR
jgi:membrane-bound lytic murein transglycosylase B